MAGRAARGRLRHRVPPHAAGARLPLRRARPSGTSATACAVTASTARPTPTSPRGPPSRSGPIALDGIVAHLGNGASITAVRAAQSVDTSMGLSPLEGLVMGTRSGDVDPTVVTHVAAATGRPVEEVIDDLNRASGLRGLAARRTCGRSPRGPRRATTRRLAIEVFGYRVKKYVGAYLAVLGGRCDALVFTGGIGQHSAVVRAAVARAWTGSASCSTPTQRARRPRSCRPTGRRSPCS